MRFETLLQRDAIGILPARLNDLRTFGQYRSNVLLARTNDRDVPVLFQVRILVARDNEIAQICQFLGAYSVFNAVPILRRALRVQPFILGVREIRCLVFGWAGYKRLTCTLPPQQRRCNVYRPLAHACH